MGRNPPNGMQRIIPYLSYADAPAAIDFLCKAFGFEERFRYPMPDGRVGHAELGYRDNVVMLASAYEGFGESPLRLPAVHGQVYCFVEDVERFPGIDTHERRDARAFDGRHVCLRLRVLSACALNDSSCPPQNASTSLNQSRSSANASGRSR